MACRQMVDYCALILPFFSAPWTEEQSCLLAEGFREWIPFGPMILGNLVGGTTQKNWIPFGEPFTMRLAAQRCFCPVHTS